MVDMNILFFFLHKTRVKIWASRGALVIKKLPANAGDIRGGSLIPRSVRSLEGGNDNPLQCSHLKNPRDRGAWQATQSTGSQRVRYNLSDLACTQSKNVMFCNKGECH